MSARGVRPPASKRQRGGPDTARAPGPNQVRSHTPHSPPACSAPCVALYVHRHALSSHCSSSRAVSFRRRSCTCRGQRSITPTRCPQNQRGRGSSFARSDLTSPQPDPSRPPVCSMHAGVVSPVCGMQLPCLRRVAVRPSQRHRCDRCDNRCTRGAQGALPGRFLIPGAGVWNGSSPRRLPTNANGPLGWSLSSTPSSCGESLRVRARAHFGTPDGAFSMTPATFPPSLSFLLFFFPGPTRAGARTHQPRRCCRASQLTPPQPCAPPCSTTHTTDPVHPVRVSGGRTVGGHVGVGAVDREEVFPQLDRHGIGHHPQERGPPRQLVRVAVQSTLLPGGFPPLFFWRDFGWRGWEGRGGYTGVHRGPSLPPMSHPYPRTLPLQSALPFYPNVAPRRPHVWRACSQPCPPRRRVPVPTATRARHPLARLQCRPAGDADQEASGPRAWGRQPRAAADPG